MEKARCNTELYSNLRAPLNNVKSSNFWGSHQIFRSLFIYVSAGLVNEDIPSEYILDLTSLDSLDIVVELE